MARDSLFGETIVWSGRATKMALPPMYRVIAAVSGVVSVITLLYAVVVATSLAVPVGGMLAFGGWCAILSVGAWRLPLVWRAGVEYIVTDKHVIWRRGRLRRSIERSAISYARIRWDRRDPRFGDLELVRAVPTGALRRKLSLTLSGIESPDRLWATVRGVSPNAPLGAANRPLPQRLDSGERVLWSGIPLASPWTMRRAAIAALGAIVLMAFVHSALRAAPAIVRIVKQHALPPATLALLIAGASLAGLLLLGVAAAAAYTAALRPWRLARATRYYVTTSRVLIRRGNEELSLDRQRIAYVIDAPSHGLHDVFLVLDGPQARALAPSGAFGEDESDMLRPVLAAIEDAETVHQILGETARLRKAA